MSEKVYTGGMLHVLQTLRKTAAGQCGILLRMRTAHRGDTQRFPALTENLYAAYQYACGGSEHIQTDPGRLCASRVLPGKRRISGTTLHQYSTADVPAPGTAAVHRRIRLSESLLTARKKEKEAPAAVADRGTADHFPALRRGQLLLRRQ